MSMASKKRKFPQELEADSTRSISKKPERTDASISTSRQADPEKALVSSDGLASYYEALHVLSTKCVTCGELMFNVCVLVKHIEIFIPRHINLQNDPNGAAWSSIQQSCHTLVTTLSSLMSNTGAKSVLFYPFDVWCLRQLAAIVSPDVIEAEARNTSAKISSLLPQIRHSLHLSANVVIDRDDAVCDIFYYLSSHGSLLAPGLDMLRDECATDRSTEDIGIIDIIRGIRSSIPAHSLNSYGKENVESVRMVAIGFHRLAFKFLEWVSEEPDARWPQIADVFVRQLYEKEAPGDYSSLSSPFKRWLLQYCQHLWPRLYADIAQGRPLYANLWMLLTASDSIISRLGAAAMLRFAPLVSFLLAEQEVSSRAFAPRDLNQALYLALTGVAVLRLDQNHVNAAQRCLTDSRFDGVAPVQTVQVLLKHGAKPQAHPSYHSADAQFVYEEAELIELPSQVTGKVQWEKVVFMFCFNFNSSELLIALFEQFPVWSRSFRFWLDSDEFRSDRSGPQPWLTEAGRQLLVKFCAWALDRHLPQLRSNPDSADCIHSVWSMMRDLGLDLSCWCYRRVDMHASLQTDEEYWDMVQVAITGRGLGHSFELSPEMAEALIMWLKKDTRWDPNHTMMVDCQPVQLVFYAGAKSGVNFQVLKHIIADVDIMARDSSGLCVAAHCTEKEALYGVIFERQFNPTATDDAGRTYLHQLAASNDSRQYTWLKMLDPLSELLMATDNHGHTPLDLALLQIDALAGQPRSLSARPSPNAAMKVCQLICWCMEKPVPGYPVLDIGRVYTLRRPLAHFVIEWGSYALFSRLTNIHNTASELKLNPLNPVYDTSGLAIDFLEGAPGVPNALYCLHPGVEQRLLNNMFSEIVQLHEYLGEDSNVSIITIIFNNVRKYTAVDATGQHTTQLSNHPSSFPLAKSDSSKDNALQSLVEPLAHFGANKSAAAAKNRKARMWQDFMSAMQAAHAQFDLLYFRAFAKEVAIELINQGALTKFVGLPDGPLKVLDQICMLIKLLLDTTEDVPFTVIDLLVCMMKSFVDKAPPDLSPPDTNMALVTCQLRELPAAVNCLSWAVRNHIDTLVTVLLELNVDPTVITPGSQLPPLFIACLPVTSSECSAKIFEQLLRKCSPAQINMKIQAKFALIQYLGNQKVVERNAKMAAFLRAGGNPDARLDGTAPPLVTLTLQKQIDCAAVVLQHGGNPNLHNKDGLNFLHAVCRDGSLRLLRELRALVNMPDKMFPWVADFSWQATCTTNFSVRQLSGTMATEAEHGCTGLHIAAFNGFNLVVEFLLQEARVTVDIVTTTKRYTALHLAAKGGSRASVTNLLHFGADANARDADGYTPLHHAAQQNQIPAAQVLLSHLATNPLATADNGKTALAIAFEMDHQELAAIIFNRLSGSNMNALKHSIGDSDADMEILGLLVASFAPKIFDDDATVDRTDLARLMDNFDTLHKAFGGKLSRAKGKCGCTLLITAVRKAHTKLYTGLLKHGLDGSHGICQKHYPHGYDLLSVAVEFDVHKYRLQDILKLYADAGRAWEDADSTPFHLIAQTGSGVAIDDLCDDIASRVPTDTDADTDTDTFMHGTDRPRAAAARIAAVLNRAARGVPPGAPSIALHMAAARGHSTVVRQLLARGAYCDVRDASGVSPLLRAVEAGKMETLRCLLAAAGAHSPLLEARDGNGLSPLMAAAETASVEMVELLLRSGADLHARTISGDGVMHFAARNPRWITIVPQLVNLGLSLLDQNLSRAMPVHTLFMDPANTPSLSKIGLTSEQVREALTGDPAFLSRIVSLSTTVDLFKALFDTLGPADCMAFLDFKPGVSYGMTPLQMAAAVNNNDLVALFEARRAALTKGICNMEAPANVPGSDQDKEAPANVPGSDPDKEAPANVPGSDQDIVLTSTQPVQDSPGNQIPNYPPFLASGIIGVVGSSHGTLNTERHQKNTRVTSL